MSESPNTLSCICVTGGRINHLQAAIACFQEQKCSWPRELVILNTCPQQEINMAGAELSGVKIINLSTRPSSLGAARNMAIQKSIGTHLVTWDDDDLYAPWHLQSFADRFTSDALDWVFLDKYFYSESGRIRKISQGMWQTLAFTKKAWEKVGRIAEMSLGEDREFIGRLTANTPGVNAQLGPHEMSFIYCWGNQAHHISGVRENSESAWNRAEIDIKRKISMGAIKTGKITLTPKVHPSPAERIGVFLKRSGYLRSPTPVNIANPKFKCLWHAVERHTEPTIRRKLDAQAAWDALYTQGVNACHYWNYARDATSIGDKRKLPFLKDVLKFALDQAADDDIVFLTNDDTALHPQLPEFLLKHVNHFGPCSSQRCEYNGRIPKLTLPPELIYRGARQHVGRDLFAAKKSWWLANWEEIGDPILGASDWDLHLAALVRKTHGIMSTRNNLVQAIPPAEIPLGYVLHQFHVPKWSERGNVNTAASQIHNRLAFKTWALQHMPSLIFKEGNVI